LDRLRAITLFCRAVEAKSFTAAAHGLNLAPSVLSKAIATLESELGCRLFNRTTRRLALTEAGANYYEHCRNLVTALEEAEAAARGDARVSGVLRIGVHPAMRALLMHHLDGLLADHPRLSVEIIVTNSPAALVDDGLDMVLRIGALSDSSFVAQRLAWTKAVICASPRYLRAHSRPRHPHELTQHRAIVPGRRDEDSFARWSFARGSERAVVAVPVALMVRDGIGLVDAAVGSVGVARIYDVSARPYLDAGSLEQLLKDWSCERAPIYAMRPSGNPVPSKVRAFFEFARRVLRPVGKG
jgi:DNA-binding transcriptional LysR family regulator